jgi:gas vesicle protein
MANERIYYSREAEQIAQQQRTILALGVMVVGLGIGAVLALMFAPRRGDEFRDELASQANVALDGTGKALRELQRDFDHLRNDVEDRLKHATR